MVSLDPSVKLRVFFFSYQQWTTQDKSDKQDTREGQGRELEEGKSGRNMQVVFMKITFK